MNQMVSLVTGVLQMRVSCVVWKTPTLMSFVVFFSQYSQQIFSVAPKINQRPLPYAFLHFCSHAHLFVYLYIVPVVEVIFELNRLIYNKINYIRQHYFLLIHKATCFDPSVGHLQIYIAD